LGWVGLGWVGLGWVGLGWVGLGWVGLGWRGEWGGGGGRGGQSIYEKTGHFVIFTSRRQSAQTNEDDEIKIIPSRRQGEGRTPRDDAFLVSESGKHASKSDGDFVPRPMCKNEGQGARRRLPPPPLPSPPLPSPRHSIRPTTTKKNEKRKTKNDKIRTSCPLPSPAHSPGSCDVFETTTSSSRSRRQPGGPSSSSPPLPRSDRSFSRA
jgi:hypothetical protein